MPTTLEKSLKKLTFPLPIKEIESIEAELMKPWDIVLSKDLNASEKFEFIQYFAQIGFLPKYKSYGVKNATPFGYSIFDLKDGEGFSIQVHEVEKIEAFHILKAHKNAFVLLSSRENWTSHKEDFLNKWQTGEAEKSEIAFKPIAGDVAIVEDLNIVHTVVGCILEEYANTSYDVVTRLHDQNEGNETILPEANKPIAELLQEVESFTPQKLKQFQNNSWDEKVISNNQIVDLSSKGLIGKHLLIDTGEQLQVDDDSVVTIVALEGETMLSVDNNKHLIQVGGTTTIPPNTKINLENASIYPSSRVAICQVDKTTAFADLR